MEIILPKLYRWDGGQIIPNAYSFGYMTGRDHDLICVKPNLSDNIEAKIALSPVCSTRLLSISAYLLKRLLIQIDQNLRGR